jgi:hypothetical protein
MSSACLRFRFGLDDDDAREPDSAEQHARAEHLLVCADCTDATKGIVAQRTIVAGAFASSEAPPPLSESLITRFVQSMTRAARGDADRSGARTA